MGLNISTKPWTMWPREKSNQSLRPIHWPKLRRLTSALRTAKLGSAPCSQCNRHPYSYGRFRADHGQLRRKSRRRWIYGSDLDAVTELASCSSQRPRAVLAQFGIAFYSSFDVPNSVMQDLPDDAAEPMGDGPNGRLIAQSRQQTPEHCLAITAFLPGRSVGRLVQHPPQVFVSFC